MTRARLKFAKPESRKTAKGRKDRDEARVARNVRGLVDFRDGHCRVGKVGLPGLFGMCTTVSEWAHLEPRARTRGMAPEQRHTTATSAKLCGGPNGGHHYALDEGTGARRLTIEALTDRGADGPLRFTMDGFSYEELDGKEKGE